VPDSDPLRLAGEPVSGMLVVPVRDCDGALTSLQFIPPPGAGKKLNLPGASMTGVFVVGDVETGGTAYLCEGIGQAWACWKATGFPSVVCFGSGRVRVVATELRQRDPSARLVVVSDVGKEHEAEAIAREVRGQYVAMPAGWEKNTDVNDYAQREGFDALEALLHSTREPVADGVVLRNAADLTPQPVSWLWRDWLALGKLHILAGAPGQGKTTIALARQQPSALADDGQTAREVSAAMSSSGRAKTTRPIRCCLGSSRLVRKGAGCTSSLVLAPTASCSPSTQPPTWSISPRRQRASAMCGSSWLTPWCLR
jgi:hypothetical protein